MSDAPNPRISALYDWLTAQGADLAACRPAAIPGMGTGLVATRDLDPGDRILLIPRNVWFTRKTAHTSFADVLAHAMAEEIFSHSMCVPALLLLLERTQPDSFFRPYLDALSTPTMPFGGVGQDEVALQSALMAGWVAEQAELADQDAARARDVLPSASPDRVRAEWLTSEAWRWAYGHIVQRSFSVDIGEDEVWLLVPGMDLCNHESGIRNGYFAEAEGWLLEATRPVEAGEQITISYGKAKTSAEFFLYYGFVPGANPNDRVYLELVPEDGDPNAGDKAFLCDELGLSREALVAADGILPDGFRNAAVLHSLDAGDFARDDIDFNDPRYESAALERIATVLTQALERLPTTQAQDESLRGGAAPDDPMVPAYGIRIAFKQILSEAAASLERQAADLRAGEARPNQRTPDLEEGRHALIEIQIPIGPSTRR